MERSRGLMTRLYKRSFAKFAKNSCGQIRTQDHVENRKTKMHRCGVCSRSAAGHEHGYSGSRNDAGKDQTHRRNDVGQHFFLSPLGFIENGKQVGFDVDLATEIAKRMNVKLVYEQIDFRGIIAALTSKRVDLLITGMVYTPDRAKQIAYSEPYFNGGVAAAYRPDKPIKQPDDLVGKTVG